MRWLKKIVRAILALLPAFIISMCMTQPSFASSHDYNGILWSSSHVPSQSCTDYDSTSHSYIFSSSKFSQGCGGYSPINFMMKFEGDSSSSLPSGLKYSNSTLDFDSDGDFSNLLPGFFSQYNTITYINDSFYSRLFPQSYLEDYGTSDYYFGTQFGTANLPSFNLDSISSSLNISCNSFSNGAVCPGLWNMRDYVNDQILNFPYSSDGFYVHSSAISNSDGQSFTHSFDFSDLFDSIPNRFSELVLPLNDKDGFYLNPSNLTSGRSFEFKGEFEFDGSFAWHSNPSQDSFWRLYYYGVSSSSGQDYDGYVDCTVNQTLVNGLNHLSYSCPLTLPSNSLVFIPYLYISGDGNYVWDTDSPWRFINTVLVTDNDDTPGDSFNTHLDGGGTIPGDANNENTEGGAYNSLLNLFNFTFINPFYPLYGMFSDNSSCASIPTLAGMIHSEETEVCPWFDSGTRAIVTPVLSIASMMLIFGVAVKWLKSSSGNMFEDAGHDKGGK